jgi:DNA ligase 1
MDISKYFGVKMNSCASHIWALESHPSRLNKEAIIEAIASGTTSACADEFFAGCRLALDSMITFGLKQIPEKTNADGAGLDWSSFYSTVQLFITRKCTGNAARDTVVKLMDQATKEQWNGWYRRILIKDLRCGVSEKTINKVVEKKYADYAIPVFSCQLAHDSANHEAKVRGSRFIEVKLDGVRVITIAYPDGRVNMFSRNGKEFVNFPHIAEQFKAITSTLTEPWVFDGEIMSSSFQDLMKQVHRKSDVQAEDAVLHLFDCIPLEHFEKGIWNATQEFRSNHLKKFMEHHQDALPNVTMVGQELVDLDSDIGQSKYKEINALAIKGGYEGIMIKDPRAPYECKRSVSWLKLKPFIEVTLEVIDVEEGTGKNAGRLGAIVCTGTDDGRTIKTNCGSGFSDGDRISYWASRARLAGQLVEVRADAITQNQDGTYSLRFPRFLRFRGFVAGEKL